jgi:hypothetical protein
MVSHDHQMVDLSFPSWFKKYSTKMHGPCKPVVFFMPEENNNSFATETLVDQIKIICEN